ncbi:MAG TPA: electron transfer flavoprotein subunit beta/FixA family protein [Spirochaetota bacterium]|nr:electron transfer flavoprotein subunit beta/FixA family protein [Spirochaetota bacterium]HOM37847.1 electron transfer flavoprotein subunit beta/FixA family protein [Spirochaetota bacterium]HPQ49276.1 electron transfer flavoprotein subunit beta/FixA family protein [Spirochaetota bacterium]
MYKIVVLVKQVPDTHNITANAMKEDGTVNRAALPTIFNPEDLNALEAALEIKDKFGAEVTAITMGPPAAADVLRECLYRGADKVILLTDRAFAGADTLATSYVISEAIKKLGKVDIVFAGRQAIDGDTAQVGPQTAEKLDIPQIGYMLELKSLKKDVIEVKRAIENGVEVVKCKLPVLITVTEQTNTPRFPSAKKVAVYKKAMTKSEINKIDPNQSYIDPSKYSEEYLRNKGLLIEEWGLNDLKLDPSMCGFAGSPTKVYKIDSVVLEAKETKNYEPTFEGVSTLIHELIQQHIIG